MTTRLCDPSLSFLVMTSQGVEKISCGKLKCGDLLVTQQQDTFVKVEDVISTSSASIVITPYKGEKFHVATNSLIAAKTSAYKRVSSGDEVLLYAGDEDMQKEHVIHRFKIYYTKLHLPPKQYLISPYLMGYWCCKRSGRILKISRADILAKLKEECKRSGFGLHFFHQDKERKSYEPSPQVPDTDGFKEVTLKRKAPTPTGKEEKMYRMDDTFLTLLHKSNIKCVNFPTQPLPVEYINGSLEQRIDLLSGVLDAVSYMQNEGCTFDLTLRDQDLLMTIEFVARSIGLSTNVKETGELNSGRFTNSRVVNPDGSLKVVNRLWISGNVGILRCANVTKQVSRDIKARNVTGMSVEISATHVPFIKLTTDKECPIVCSDFTVFSGVERK